MNTFPRRSRGFTLIEVMITVVIVAILASIAFPSYQEYVLRSNRSEGQALLVDASARQERYYTQNNTYADTTAKLGYASANSPTGLYTLGISNVSATTYTLTASTVRSDPKCGNLGLNQVGTRTKSGTASAITDCWK